LGGGKKGSTKGKTKTKHPRSAQGAETRGGRGPGGDARRRKGRQWDHEREKVNPLFPPGKECEVVGGGEKAPTQKRKKWGGVVNGREQN